MPHYAPTHLRSADIRLAPVACGGTYTDFLLCHSAQIVPREYLQDQSGKKAGEMHRGSRALRPYPCECTDYYISYIFDAIYSSHVRWRLDIGTSVPRHGLRLHRQSNGVTNAVVARFGSTYSSRAATLPQRSRHPYGSESGRCDGIVSACNPVPSLTARARFARLPRPAGVDRGA
jgi:hypothetical protein